MQGFEKLADEFALLVRPGVDLHCEVLEEKFVLGANHQKLEYFDTESDRLPQIWRVEEVIVLSRVRRKMIDIFV